MKSHDRKHDLVESWGDHKHAIAEPHLQMRDSGGDRLAHYNDVIMNAMASQITSLTIVYSAVYSRCRSKKTPKLRVTGLCTGNSPVPGEFPVQRASNTENVSIWWRHHVTLVHLPTTIKWCRNNNCQCRCRCLYGFRTENPSREEPGSVFYLRLSKVSANEGSFCTCNDFAHWLRSFPSIEIKWS